jgi:AraC-like DNA-binding protein
MLKVAVDQAEHFSKIRFSTADLPEQDRLAIWREQYGRKVLRVDVEPRRDTPLEATMISRRGPDLQLLFAAMSAGRIARAREFLADGNDELALVVNRAGILRAAGRGREITLRAGDAVLMSSGEVSAFERIATGGSFAMRIPHWILASLVADIDAAVMRFIPRGTPVLKLLMNYADPLLHDDVLAAPDLRRLAVTHVHDLVALTLGALREAANVAQGRGVRAARLATAKAYIADACGNAALSIGTVARHLGVTPRYLQSLFENDGGTFSNYLRSQRLARAHRMLTNPAFESRPVTAIAYEAGFADLSYFNRCFRQRYGATPRDIREKTPK